jgi:hypothetical protein
MSVQDEERAAINQGDSDKEEEGEAKSGPTHAEAFTALETAVAWRKWQSECRSTEVLLLKGIRDLAAKER